MLEAMSHMLTQKLSTKQIDDELLKVFSIDRPMRMHLLTYLEFLQDELDCSSAVFSIAYLNIEKLLDKHPKFCINNSNLLRLVFTAIVVAFKFTEDESLEIARMAKLGRISTSEMFVLESSLMAALD